jgi:biopolymer transport protein ExbD
MDPELDAEWAAIRPDLMPLIDGVFLLLIFFMVSMVFARPVRLEVDLAEAENPTSVARKDRAQLVIASTGQLELDGQAVLAQNLGDALKGKVEANPKTRLIVLVDRNAEHAYTLEAMEAAEAAGFGRIFLATRSHRSESAP